MMERDCSVATQANLLHTTQGYVSDDDMTRRVNRVSTGRISREDFREQYCINERALQGLDKSRSTSFLFGCLSSYQESPCKKKDNLFTSCYGRHPSDDENLHHVPSETMVGTGMGGRRAGPPQRWSHSHEQFMETTSSGDEGGFESNRRPQSVAVSRENLYNEAKRYTWNEQMERYVERGSGQDWTRRLATRYPSAPVPQIESTRKHVSFDCSSLARSATSNSFDEHKIRRARWEVVLMNRQSSSQERLLDGRKTPDMTAATVPPVPEKKRTTKTQATQTETFIIRASGPPPYLSLSPRTSYRVRMVSQGAQTNGGLMDKNISQSLNLSDSNGGRSAGSGHHNARDQLTNNNNKLMSNRQQQQQPNRAPLQKTLSDGEILLERKKAITTGYLDVDLDAQTTAKEEPAVTKYRVNEKPVRFSNDVVEILNEEEFHENILGLLRSPTTTNSEPSQPTVMAATTAKKIQFGGSMDSGCSRETESSRKTTSPTESSSSGSYSLFDYNNKSKLKLDFSIPRSPAVPCFQEDNWLTSKVAMDDDDDSQKLDNSVFANASPTISNNKFVVEDSLLELVVKPPEGWGDSPDSSNGQTCIERSTTPQNILMMSMDMDDDGEEDDDQAGQRMRLRDEGPPTPPITEPPPPPIKKKRSKYRCKSEERPFKESTRSDAATQSSISLHASLHDLTTIDDDDSGIYMEPYTLGVWVYIGESEELQVWQKHEPVARTSSGESTMSEREFRKKFTALTHRMVHRKASGETYKRLATNTLEINKRVTLTRQGGEFGFRIHGSRPVVVSAVEATTPAEDSGLEVGDVIMTINGIDVLDSSHSDVVRIAAKTDLLEMELARTANVLPFSSTSSDIVFSGILFKLHDDDWVQRWFCLKTDYCLHYYKTESSTVPLGAVSLVHCHLRHVTQSGRGSGDQEHIFQIQRSNGPSLTLAAFDKESKDAWMNFIDTAIQQSAQDDKWVALSGRYVMGPPDAILNSDCSGILAKLGRRLKTWTRRFCVLKDACIYFFTSEEVTTALGAAHLHGYRVQTVSSLGGKKHAFELIPPLNTMRTYYLSADTENERKRWLAALEYSIDRWINLGK